MVTTRSMSGTTKKADTKIVVNDKLRAAKIPSNKAKSRKTRGCTYAVWSVMDDAYCLFMGDRKDEHYEKHPPRPTRGKIPKELELAIMQEWRDMSDKDKAPFLKRAEEMRAKGCTLA